MKDILTVNKDYQDTHGSWKGQHGTKKIALREGSGDIVVNRLASLSRNRAKRAFYSSLKLGKEGQNALKMYNAICKSEF